ncbi:MAG: hypothetical protein PHY47_16900 [Lachnospiraceae bacterium]|nr:hypothetical protein [Lachnospiraceae bacterium]
MDNFVFRGVAVLLRLLLKIVCLILNLVLTVLYFMIGTAGSVFAGIGYFSGSIIGIVTIIFWIFGEYSTWQQVVGSFALAVGVFLVPLGLTKYGTVGLLWLMDRVDDLEKI